MESGKYKRGSLLQRMLEPLPRIVIVIDEASHRIRTIAILVDAIVRSFCPIGSDFSRTVVAV